ncbi:hypothetical protein EBL89_12155 [Cereibacter sphaeroides]|uniref:hypothetical protein n=1 Tax=Cereibacter sphaeroides TaxID=1063 RepID=UPI000F535B1F|nr:hypothetical protein [Cereibacter sphaeroides]AZB56041.1 hypothetical protein EBL89_12155 [Cereibacter sphaeroides]AZB60304.1 hypothetical protein EBL88_12105 [Cereibacter sphaeroides]
MKSGAFIKAVSQSYRVEEKTVTVYARFLREAGLLTTGARGVNAPDMTPLDAARITIALLATDMPSRCVEAVRRFAKLTYQPDRSSGSHPSVLGVVEGVSLEQVLTNIFGAQLSEDPFGAAPYFEIQENAGSATIEHKGGHIYFRNTDRSEEEKAFERAHLFGIRRSRGVASVEMLSVYVLLCPDFEEQH